MQRFSRYGWWFVVLGIMACLVVAFRQCGINPVPSARSLDDWELSELVEHLNVKGLNVHLQSTQQNGAIGQTAFLTLTERNWRSLNALKKDKKCIHEWRGVLFCERVGESDTAYFAEQWGDQCLAVGPFLFYGDTELLHRVRSALTSSAPLEVH